MAYFAQRYPELKPADVNDLRQLGERFVQPPKAAAVVEEAKIAEPVDVAPVVVVTDALEGEDVSADGSMEQNTETADVEEAETVPA